MSKEPPIRKNTDLDLIDDCVDKLHEITSNNDDGIGVIRINDGGMMVVEYYKSIEDSKTVITNPSNNLIMLKCQDAVYFNRKNVRILCIDRYISITK